MPWAAAVDVGHQLPVSLKQLPYAKVVELYRGHMSFFSAEDRKRSSAGQCSACGLRAVSVLTSEGVTMPVSLRSFSVSVLLCALAAAGAAAQPCAEEPGGD